MPSETSMAGPNAPVVALSVLEGDPHGTFRKYRRQVPFILRDDGTALVLRNADVLKLATDPRTRQAETEVAKLRGIEGGTLLKFFQYSMLTSNGDAHRRRRSAFSTAFAFRAIAALRPYIRKVTDDLIDEWYSEGEIDLVDRFASELPARIIAHILGIPWEDVPAFTQSVYTSTRVLSAAVTADELPDIENAASWMLEYIERLFADRRKAPRDDFLSAYLTQADAAGEMSAIEILIQILLVIGAGSDTTRGALAIQTSLLLQHRDQWDAVCSDARLIEGAVAEALRFEPSVGSFSRFALEDIEIDGQVIKAGRFMQLSTMSAMRDEMVFRDPDVFDIRRTDQQRWHLVFGAGAHRCLGEALARTELEEGLAALTARVPDLQFSGPVPQVEGHTSIRDVGTMRVRWRGKLN